MPAESVSLSTHDRAIALCRINPPKSDAACAQECRPSKDRVDDSGAVTALAALWRVRPLW